MLDKKSVLIGYSGHGYVVAEAALQSDRNLMYYAEKAKVDSNPFNLQYLGFEGSPDFKWTEDLSFILGIGDNVIRGDIARHIGSQGGEILNIVHPSASLSKMITMGKGIFIGRNASVNPLVSIGDGCILNTSCIIEHECRILSFAHIAPGAVLAGNVEVGHYTFIGANAVVKQGVKVGSNVVVGAGAVVLKDVTDGVIVYGNPARIKGI